MNGSGRIGFRWTAALLVPRHRSRLTRGPEFPGARRAVWSAALGVLLATSSLPAGAAEELSLVGAKNGSLELAVPASGRVPLVFHRPPTEDPAAFDIDLGPFLSEDDQSASVAILGGAGAGEEPGGVGASSSPRASTVPSWSSRPRAWSWEWITQAS
jgi:hypothetical protein